MPQNEGEQEPVVVRDRRRIDPDTGQVRTPSEVDQDAAAPTGRPAREVAESMSGTLDDELAQAAGEPQAAEAAGQEAGGEASGLQTQVDELTADLKRVSAEFANYRKRVERDREAMIAAAKASVAADLLTVLDDIERAEAHGDLNGAFKAVADKLLGSLNAAGLEPFAREGDEFDPSVHEAVQHTTSPEVSGPTVTAVLRKGYRFGDRVLRPAMVAVTDHEPAAAADEEPAEQAQES